MRQVHKFRENSLIDNRSYGSEEANYNKVMNCDQYINDSEKKILENRLVMPIYIQDVEFDALIDPGSTISIMSTTALKRLGYNLPEDNSETKVSLADDAYTVVSSLDEKLKIVCNGRRIYERPCIMPLDKFDFIIGADLFHKFGMKIFSKNIKKNNDLASCLTSNCSAVLMKSIYSVNKIKKKIELKKESYPIQLAAIANRCKKELASTINKQSKKVKKKD